MTLAADETVWILDPAQVRCLAGSRRHDIVDRLAGAGAQSVRELADWLGAKPSALYHHIQQLIDTGLIRPAGHRNVNRRREQLYDTPARRIRLPQTLDDAGVADSLLEVATSLARQAERDYRRGLDCEGARAAGPTRNLGFGRLLARPDTTQLRRINALLEALAEVMAESRDADSPAVILNWTLAPGAGASD